MSEMDPDTPAVTFNHINPHRLSGLIEYYADASFLICHVRGAAVFCPTTLII